jgi:hypothetical protein
MIDRIWPKAAGQGLKTRRVSTSAVGLCNKREILASPAGVGGGAVSRISLRRKPAFFVLSPPVAKVDFSKTCDHR